MGTQKDLPRIWASMSNDLFYTRHFQQNETMGEVYVTFNKKPTAQEKFLYVYGLLKKCDKLPNRLIHGNPKSNKDAREIRSTANVAFQNKNYVSALIDYNASLRVAKTGSKDYALALANRSAALYHLEEYDDCISNIYLALKTKNYPKETIYKLYEREVKCLVKLGKITQAKFKFNKLLSYLTQVCLPEEKKKSIEMEIKLLLEESSKENKDKVENEKIVIKLLGGSNKNIPALSKFVKINHSESMSRCLVVSTDIQPGDVLAIEKPYAGMLKNDSLNFNCNYCFKWILNGIPCFRCSRVVFCDENCQLKSYENGHKYECILMFTFNVSPGMSHMEHLSLHIFLTTICKLGLDKYVSTVCSLNSDNTDSITKGFNNDGKYLSDLFCSTYTLEGNETKRTVTDLFIRHCYAAVMISLVMLTEIHIPEHQLGIIGESLVHIMCVVSSNAHEIYQSHKTWNLDGLKKQSTPVADCLLPVLSLLNHHCDPNVVRHSYDNGVVVLRAIQPIPINSQLFDNYGEMYATNPKISRQKNLKIQYKFNCECTPCKEDWPMYQDLKSELKAELILSTNFDVVLFKKQSDKLNSIISEVKDKNVYNLQHIPFLYTYLNFLHNNIKKPLKEYCACQETIKEILSMTSDQFAIEN